MHFIEQKKFWLNKTFSKREGVKLCNLGLMCDGCGGDGDEVCDCIYSTICVNGKKWKYLTFNMSASLTLVFSMNQLLELNYVGQ